MEVESEEFEDGSEFAPGGCVEDMVTGSESMLGQQLVEGRVRQCAGRDDGGRRCAGVPEF